jgi:hypothetical protein
VFPSRYARGVVLVTVLLAGCASPGATPSDALVAPTGTQSASPTASASPTERPTPSPIAEGRANEREMLERAITSMDTLLEFYDALLTAVSGPDPEIELRLAAREMTDWTEREREWLLNHEPDPCYAESWDAYLSVIEAWRTVAELSEDVADEPSNTVAAETALAAIDNAVEVMNERQGAFGESSC